MAPRLSADKDLADSAGCTALMPASYEGHVEATSLLLQAGTDQGLADNRGRTAWSMTSDLGWDEGMNLMQAASIDDKI